MGGILLAGCLCTVAIGQDDGASQSRYTGMAAPASIQANSTSAQIIPVEIKGNSHATSAHEPRELHVFFLIGMIINVVMMVSFAVFFAREWKRNKDRKTPGNSR